MIEFADSYVMRVLFAPPKRRPVARRRRWPAASPPAREHWAMESKSACAKAPCAPDRCSR